MFLVKSLVSEYPEKWGTEVWKMERVLHEINRDHSADFEKYDEYDWKEGWKEWVSPEFHIMLGEIVNGDLEPYDNGDVYTYDGWLL
jgi:hypothetical protein